MSDGIAPAIDKVGAAAPSAPEAQAGAPTLGNTALTGPPAVVNDVPVKEPEKDPSPAQHPPPSQAKPLQPSEMIHALERTGPALSVPKPVEVMSVPETPVNGTTPAGGTPRPELNIPVEPVQSSQPVIPVQAVQPAEPVPLAPPVEEKKEPVVAAGVLEPQSTPSVPTPDNTAADSAKSVGALNGENKTVEMTGALQDSPDGSKEDRQPEKPVESTKDANEPVIGEKRKLEEAPPSNTVLPVLPPESQKTEADPITKKPKTDSDESKADVNGGRPAAKVGRPKKEKKPPVVGRAARKTRSQGPADV